MDWKFVSIFFVSRTLISMIVTCAPQLNYEVEKAKKMVKEPRKTISTTSEVCSMTFLRLETVCKDAVKAVKKEYRAQGFEFKANEDVSVATTYKLTKSLCKSLFVKACECPTIPTIYLRDKSSKSNTRTIIVTIVKPKKSGLLGWFGQSESKSNQQETRSSSLEKPVSQPKWDDYDDGDELPQENDKKAGSNNFSVQRSNVDRQASGNLTDSSRRDGLTQNLNVSSHNDSKRSAAHQQTTSFSSNPPDDKPSYDNGNNSHDNQGDGDDHTNKNLIQTTTRTTTNEDNIGSTAHQQNSGSSTHIPENKPKFDSVDSSQDSSGNPKYDKIDLESMNVGNIDADLFGLGVNNTARNKSFNRKDSQVKEEKLTLVFDGSDRGSSNENVLKFDDWKSDRESHHDNLLKFDDLRSDRESHHESLLNFDNLKSDRESHHDNLLKFDDLRSDRESHHESLLNFHNLKSDRESHQENLLKFDDWRSDAGDNKDDFFTHQERYDQTHVGSTGFNLVDRPSYDEVPLRQYDTGSSNKRGQYYGYQTKNDYDFNNDEMVVNKYRRFNSKDVGNGSDVKWDKK